MFHIIISSSLVFRVEPLVCKEYISKRPVIIPYHRGGKRLHIGFQVEMVNGQIPFVLFRKKKLNYALFFVLNAGIYRRFGCLVSGNYEQFEHSWGRYSLGDGKNQA